jgi:hypothetical protein
MPWSTSSETWTASWTHRLYWVKKLWISAVAYMWQPSIPRSSVRNIKNVNFATYVSFPLWGASVAQPLNRRDATSSAQFTVYVVCLCVCACLCVYVCVCLSGKETSTPWSTKYSSVRDSLTAVNFLVVRYHDCKIKEIPAPCNGYVSVGMN